MCTLVILHRPDHPWPLLVAGNRDEMRDRVWQPPSHHWEDRPDVIAGLDTLGGGSWFGVNDQGVVAVVLNREGTLGPAPGKRSRGELVLEALDHGEATEAAQALADLEPRAYRAFNLFIGDAQSAFWLRNQQNAAAVEVFQVAPGLHMLAAGELDDQDAARIRVYLPRFRAAPVPDPESGDWRAWQSLLASRLYPDSAASPSSGNPGSSNLGAMNLDLPSGFGTVCSHLVAIPRHSSFGQRPIFLFANGAPHKASFEPVPLSSSHHAPAYSPS